ncbi:MAG TPA: DUF1761 domain-containing protein [Casimicrobiaceae bacterium]
MSGVKHVPVIVAAVIFFALGAAWYTALSAQWLAGIGKTMADVQRDTGGGAMPYIVGFLAVLVMCYTLAWAIVRFDKRSAGEGAAVGVAMAIGFVAASLALNYGFEGRGIALWAINAGYATVGLAIAGAIIGRYARPAAP